MKRLEKSSAARADTLLSRESYAFLQKFIRQETGIVIEDDKEYLLQSRLQPIMASNIAKELKLNTLEMLVEKLASGTPSSLIQLVADGVTTNETFFFRDESVFESLRTEMLPSLFKQLDGMRKVRIWSAASSTGQEAYSIALLLSEMGKTRHDVEIVGTDISWRALERAKQGRYLQFEVSRGLLEDQVKKYFVKVGNEWQLKDEIRSMVHFEQADLRRDLRRLGRFDLIFCRNVLIYFDVETKRQIIGSLEPMLNEGGALVLGCAETVINLFDRLQRKQVAKATFYCAS